MRPYNRGQLLSPKISASNSSMSKPLLVLAIVLLTLTLCITLCYAAVMSSEIPLQHDLFSGELKDTRTHTQKQRDQQRALPQQHEMFSQRELAQYVNPHPKMPFYPHETLQLVSEDARTPEEIARDEQKAIEAQTYHLFDDFPEFYDATTHEEPLTTEEEDECSGDSASTLATGGDETAKLALYLELVQLCEEDAETLWIDPKYAGAYLKQIALTVLEAQAVGLTAAEMEAAIQIGRSIGSERKRLSGLLSVSEGETGLQARRR